jgi:hypothetical protein
MTAQPEPLDSRWRTSSFSNSSGQCVEVARLAGRIAVRDSVYRENADLRVTPRAWHSFVSMLRQS